MIAITWNQLIAANTSNPVAAKIEAFTGSRYAYGLGKAINVLDILNNVDVVSALYCLDILMPATLAIEQQAGQDMLAYWTQIWSFYRPTDQSYTQLLLRCQQLLAGTDNPANIQRNACGDIVSYTPPSSASQVLAQAQALLSVVNALPLTKVTSPQYSTLQVDPTVTFIAPDGSNTLNYIYSDSPVPSVLPGYVEHPLLEPNPATGIPTLTTSLLISEDQAFITYQKYHTGGVQPYANSAINYLGQALAMQAQAAANSLPVLSTVASFIDQAVTHYATDQRKQLQQILYVLQCVYGQSIPVAALNDYAGGNIYAAQLVAVSNATRAALLQNYSFWHSYDLDFSGSLSMNERYLAEIGLNNAVNAAVSSAALTMFNNLMTQKSTWINLNSNLSNLLRPYLV